MSHACETYECAKKGNQDYNSDKGYDCSGNSKPARCAENYNPQNEMFAAFETNRSLLKNETYPKFKKFSPGFAGV